MHLTVPVLANCMKAILGAIYEDTGEELTVVREWLEARFLEVGLDEAIDKSLPSMSFFADCFVGLLHTAPALDACGNGKGTCKMNN